MSDHRKTFLLTIAAAFMAHGVVSFISGHQAEATTPVSVPETPCVIEPKVPESATVVSLPKMPSITPTSMKAPSVKTNGKIDLAFCIDTTGSMSAEIETVKAKVKSLVAKLSKGQSSSNVRVALVAYRDQGDEYVTKVYPFSEDIDKFVKDISDLSADGGGDGPEAVDKGIHAALNELEWKSDKKTARVLYVIGDAPPHSNQTDYDLSAEARKASQKGININTIGCDALESYGADGVTAFKQLALQTNGRFQSLAYEQEVVDASGKRTTVITSGSKLYAMRPGSKFDWKAGADALVASGSAAPMLQGATNGTIGPQGSDATVIMGVNTAGTVRCNNNLEEVMLQGAQEAVGKVFK